MHHPERRREESLDGQSYTTIDREMAPAVESPMATLNKILDAFDLLIGPAASLNQAASLMMDARIEGAQITELAMAEKRLALAYRALFAYSEDVTDLETCIQLLRNVSQTCSKGDHDDALVALVEALSDCVNETQDERLLDEAINFQRQLVDLTPAGRQAWSTALINLGSLLQAKAAISGDLGFLDEAIAIRLRALSYPLPDESCRDVDITNLAALYVERGSGNREYLEEAVKLYREASELCPVGHPRHPKSLGHLASALGDVYSLTGEESHYEEATSLFSKVIEALPSDDPAMDIVLNDFGVCLYDYTRQTGNISALEPAIQLHRDALGRRPPGHPARTTSLFNLGATLEALFERKGDETAITEAMSMYNEVLQSPSAEQPDYLDALKDSARASLSLYRINGSRELLDDAVLRLRKAIDVLPENHSRRDIYLNNLACTLQFRFGDFGEVEDLNEAINLHQEAITRVSAAGQSGPDSTLGNLALALNLRYEQNGHRESLDRIVQLFRDALKSHPIGHPKRPIALNNLGATLLNVVEDTSDVSLLNEAIDHLLDASNSYPQEHPWQAVFLGNLASAFAVRFMYTQVVGSLQDAIKTMVKAKSLPHESSSQPVLMSYELSYYHLEGHSLSSAVDSLASAVSDPRASPREHLKRARSALQNCEVALRSWGKDQVNDSLCLALLLVYERVLQLLPRVAYFGLDLPTRMRELTNSEGLGVMAAAYALRLGQPETAVELLESGRATFWTQALNLRVRELNGLPPEVVEELKSLFQQLEQGSYSNPRLMRPETSPMLATEQVMIARHRNGEKAEEIIQGIRRRPGFERFLLGQPFAQLVRVAEKGPVVVLLAHEGACEAIIIKATVGTVVRVPLPRLTYESLEKTSETLHRNDLNLRTASTPVEEVALPRAGGVRRAASSKAEALLDSIWQCLVRPIIDVLSLEPSNGRKRPRVHWCPTGLFAFIPVHAAGLYTHPVRCCSDYMVSSYIPTLGALLKARTNLQPLRLSDAKALIVSEPAAPGQVYLHSALEESAVVAGVLRSVSAVTSLGGPGPLQSDEGVKMHAVIDNLPEAGIIHLVCHGLQNLSNALESGFCLRDGTLTVAKLMELDLRDAFFAYLSACETAKGDRNQPDQAIHLAAAMLFVGFRSVIGTMWTIDDLTSPFVARKVYARLLEDDLLDADAIPYALDAAVRELRRQKYSPNHWAPFIHIGA